MPNNVNYSICEIGKNMLIADPEKLKEFLLASNSEKDIQGRDTFVWIMSHYGVGEGNVPIATSKNHNIIVGYEDPEVVEGPDAKPVVLNFKSYGDVWHHKMADKKSLICMYRGVMGVFYDLLRRYINVDEIEICLPDEVKVFAEGHFIPLRNTNKAFMLQCANLLYSLKDQGYESYPDEESVAGLNLEIVANTLLKLAVQQEDLKGNKTIIKKSQVDANPLIIEALKHQVYNLAVDEIKSEIEEPVVEA